jgi:ArsR family transcriptional regulator, lead/cadmium/zinc/bismuth-responsive transcriptional repressor
MNLAKKLSEFFSVLNDETRIKILAILVDNKLTVNEIKEKVSKLNLPTITLPAISYQLKILFTHDFVRYEKKGRQKIFSLSDSHVSHILNDAIHHISSDEHCDGGLACEDNSHIKQVLNQVI